MRFAPAAAVVLALPLAALADGGARFGARLRMVAAGALPPARVGGSDGRLTVSVHVRGGAGALAALGFTARDGGGEVAYAEVSVAELARLRSAPGVSSLERVTPLGAALDHSAPASGAPAARHDLGLDGRGTLVALVDTGVDFRHRDLRAADGTTRILALLDVSQPRDQRHAELPDYRGAVWFADEIDAQLAADDAMQSPAVPVPERDFVGHGTHVAGIAVSDGLATGNGLPAGRYVGMAPAARLLVAKAAHQGSSFAEEDVLAGVRFALDRAAAAREPVVVNLSLGAPGGPHDGTSNLERALAALVGPDAPGRALVVATGNAGVRDQHAGGWALDSVELSLRFPSSAAAGEPLGIDLWSERPIDAITLVAPDGRTFGPVAAGKSLDGGDASEGHVLIDNGAGGADPLNGRTEAGVVVTGSAGAAVTAGAWRLSLAGRGGRWDGWLTDAAAAAVAPRFADHLDEDERADVPAFCPSAIAVGSWATRNAWRSIDGRTITRNLVVGVPSSFSGTGPAADGRFLPDVAAPGDFVVSTLSRDAPPSSTDSVFNVSNDPGYLVADDGLHGALRGTSQAAPHVAGAVALLFQLDPSLTTRRLRELLRTAADLRPGEPGFSPRGGFGRLDVARAARLLLRLPAGSVDAAASSVGVSRDAVPPGESRVTVSVVPRDASGAPLGPGHAVTIESDGGAFDGPVGDAGEGRYERVLVARGERGQAATITASVDRVLLASRPTVWFVVDRSEVGHPFHAAGGCRLSPRAAPGELVTLALAALLGRSLCRRRKP